MAAKIKGFTVLYAHIYYLVLQITASGIMSISTWLQTRQDWKHSTDPTYFAELCTTNHNKVLSAHWQAQRRLNCLTSALYLWILLTLQSIQHAANSVSKEDATMLDHADMNIMKDIKRADVMVPWVRVNGMTAAFHYHHLIYFQTIKHHNMYYYTPDISQNSNITYSTK